MNPFTKPVDRTDEEHLASMTPMVMLALKERLMVRIWEEEERLYVRAGGYGPHFFGEYVPNPMGGVGFYRTMTDDTCEALATFGVGWLLRNRLREGKATDSVFEAVRRALTH